MPRRVLVAVLTTLAAAAPAQAGPSKPDRLSDGPTGQGNHESAYPSISGDGRYVVFDSFASNLDPNATPPTTVLHIYRADRTTGAVRMVSKSRFGTPGEGWSEYPDISADGRYVVFNTDANDLYAGNISLGDDVIWRDIVTGETRPVNVTNTGEPTNQNYYSEQAHPLISADGKVVAFVDSGSLVGDDTSDQYDEHGHMDVYVHDVTTRTTTRVSESSTGAELPGYSRLTGLSPDGRYVGFETFEKVLPDVPGGERRGYVYDRVTGTYSNPTRTRTGGPGIGHVVDWSADNRYLVIQSYADDLVAGSTPYGTWATYLLDTATGVLTRVPNGPDGGPPNGNSYSGSISADGRLIAFSSSASNLDPNDVNLASDAFVFDRLIGTTTLVSPSMDPQQPSAGTEISDDGRVVSFSSSSSLLDPPDLNTKLDVFAVTL